MKLIFRSVKSELKRILNEAWDAGKIIERVEVNNKEFDALISEYEDAAHKEKARREGKVLYMGVWIVNTEHRPSEDNWSLFMSIDTDDDAAVDIEVLGIHAVLSSFKKQFEGPLDYLAEQVEKMTVPNHGKYAERLQEHLANLRVAIKTGTPFHVRDNGNQDVEITLDCNLCRKGA